MGNTIQENVEWLKKENLSDWITKINNIEINKILVNYNNDLLVDIGSDNDIKSIKNKIGKIKEKINQKFNILPELINSAEELRDLISSIENDIKKTIDSDNINKLIIE